MKHIFIIHSSTVLLSALGVIELDNIKHKDVIFLYGRNFTTSIKPNDIVSYDVSSEYNFWKENGLIGRRTKIKQEVKKIDDLIDRLTCEEYFAYVPHTGTHFFQSFVTNKHCIRVNWIQEGAYAFFTKPIADPFRVFIFNILFSTKRTWYQLNWDIPFHSRKRFKMGNAYALNDEFFKPLERFGVTSICITWPRFDNIDAELPQGSHIFLFESAVELGLVEKETYIAGCKELIKMCKSKSCFVKFHPNQNNENIKDIRELFKGMSVRDCRDDIPFELIMATSQNLNLYGFTTSLLKFGEDLGHNVISLKDFLINNSQSFKSYYNSMK